MAAHVDKRDKDEKSSGSTKATARSGPETGTGTSRDETAAAWNAATPTDTPASPNADGGDGGGRAADPADRVVQLDELVVSPGGSSRLSDSLTAPFSRHGQLTVTAVSVLVLGVLIYLAVNGLLVPTH